MEPHASQSQAHDSTESRPGNAVFESGGLTIAGDWILSGYHSLLQQLAALPTGARSPKRLDLSALEHIDTAGASVLASFLGPATLEQHVAAQETLAEEKAALLLAVARSLEDWQEPVPPKVSPIRLFLGHTGQQVEALGHLVWVLLGFIGQTLATMAWVLPRPKRWRITPFVAAIQDTGLNALPIVALLTFLVGAVVAFLGATVLEDFGATIYTVNLVAFSFLREFGVLLAAILLAGRTASSFTAHIGAMKVNEELDAIRTLGLSPIELLVLPRVLAMMISLPILTFVGMMAGMVGGALVCVLSLDITLTQFLAIVERDIALRHFLVGISKAPVFAFLIAVIGCLEGFKVGGSAQSVGEHTTSSVVQSIFIVILLDAIAALFFMEMGW
ncbi:ABC transporter permease [Marinobacter sp.]|uniref:ABC transporter permease n=1 Tax=Marinobacter sp. TaxID=50741 RepID=UPI0035662677